MRFHASICSGESSRSRYLKCARLSVDIDGVLDMALGMDPVGMIGSMIRMKEDSVFLPLRLQVFGRRTAIVRRVDSTTSFIRGCLSRCSVNNHDVAVIRPPMTPNDT